MAVKDYSVNDLNWARFTDDSTDASSTVKVNQSTFPVVPDITIGEVVEYLTLTGATNMNVNGSVTPQIFSWTPNPAFGNIQVTRIKLAIIADNINDFFDFANRAPLTNGLVIQSVISGLGTFIYANVKDNADFLQVSTDTASGGFAKQGNNTQDGQALQIIPRYPIKVDSTFQYQAVIQDDLTTLSYMKATVFFQTVNA